MWKMEECTQRTESPHTNRQLLCQQLAGTKKMNDHHCKPLEGVWGSQERVNSIRGCVSIGCALHIKSNIYEWRSDVPLSGGCPLTVYKIQLEKEHGQVELQPDISDVSEMWHNGLCLCVGGVQPSSPLEPQMLLIVTHWVIEAGMSDCLCCAALTRWTANNRKPA